MIRFYTHKTSLQVHPPKPGSLRDIGALQSHPRTEQQPLDWGNSPGISELIPAQVLRGTALPLPAHPAPQPEPATRRGSKT